MSCSFHDRIGFFTSWENTLQYGSLEIGQIQLWWIVTVPGLGYSAFIIFFMKFLYLWLVTLIKRVVQNKCGCFPRLYIFTFNLYLPRSPHDKYMRCSILSDWIDKGTHISVHCLHMQSFDFVFASWPGRSQILVRTHSYLYSRKHEKERCYFGISTLISQARNFQTENTYLEICKNQCWSISKFCWWLLLSWVEVVLFWEALDGYLFIRKPVQSEFQKSASLLFLTIVTVDRINNMTEVAFYLKYALRWDFSFLYWGSLVYYSKVGIKYWCHRLCHFYSLIVHIITKVLLGEKEPTSYHLGSQYSQNW